MVILELRGRFMKFLKQERSISVNALLASACEIDSIGCLAQRIPEKINLVNDAKPASKCLTPIKIFDGFKSAKTVKPLSAPSPSKVKTKNKFSVLSVETHKIPDDLIELDPLGKIPYPRPTNPVKKSIQKIDIEKLKV